jgi:3-deoxy-7-phosphoheptulonate synthase
MGLPGLKILAKARELTGLPIVTEAVDPQSLELVSEYADIVQIGARNMQNFSLLAEAGKQKKPVMLKRGLSATIEEWLQAAEYVLHHGNERVILCERGVRSFDSVTRNMLDLAAVVALQLQSHLPVVVDPSHGTGRKPMVGPMARAAVAAGANGIMVDVHDRPKEALCDGPQAISPEEFASLVPSLQKIREAVDEENTAEAKRLVAALPRGY